MPLPAFFTQPDALPKPLREHGAAICFASLERLAGTKISLEGAELLPPEPSLLASNASQRFDALTLRLALMRERIRCVSVVPERSLRGGLASRALRGLGVVPMVTMAQLVSDDLSAALGRPPSAEEERSLRAHLERGEDIRPSLARRVDAPRSLFGRPFEPRRGPYRAFALSLRRELMAETVRLCAQAIEAGYHVHVHPEAHVSPTLGEGEHDVVQLARALSVPIVPLGISGLPGAFLEGAPLPRRASVHIRFGDAYNPPLDALPQGFRPFDEHDEPTHRATLRALTVELMARIDALLDPAQRGAPRR